MATGAITTATPSELTKHAPDNYLTNTSGVLSWLFTLDHKRIGVMYLVGILSSFLLGGILALTIRFHLLAPDGAISWLTNDRYNQVFTLHGAIMVFLFIIPSVPAALGNFLVPVMLGAKEMIRLTGCSCRFCSLFPVQARRTAPASTKAKRVVVVPCIITA